MHAGPGVHPVPMPATNPQPIEITMAELAITVRTGFERMDERLDSIQRDGTNTVRLATLELRQELTKECENKIREHDQKHAEEVREKQAAYDAKHLDSETRLDRLEALVNKAWGVGLAIGALAGGGAAIMERLLGQ